MTRAELEHIIRASTAISEDDEIVVVGSQSVLGQYPAAPAELCVSNGADVYPRNHPERAELIEGNIGELSPFHSTFGYYAQGVSDDLALAKYTAAREKDHELLAAAIAHDLLNRAELERRLADLPVAEPSRGRIAQRLVADFAKAATRPLTTS